MKEIFLAKNMKENSKENGAAKRRRKCYNTKQVTT
jgi:hypothetical protein